MNSKLLEKRKPRQKSLGSKNAANSSGIGMSKISDYFGKQIGPFSQSESPFVGKKQSANGSKKSNLSMSSWSRSRARKSSSRSRSRYNTSKCDSVVTPEISSDDSDVEIIDVNRSGNKQSAASSSIEEMLSQHNNYSESIALSSECSAKCDQRTDLEKLEVKGSKSSERKLSSQSAESESSSISSRPRNYRALNRLSLKRKTIDSTEDDTLPNPAMASCESPEKLFKSIASRSNKEGYKSKPDKNIASTLRSECKSMTESVDDDRVQSIPTDTYLVSDDDQLQAKGIKKQAYFKLSKKDFYKCSSSNEKQDLSSNPEGMEKSSGEGILDVNLNVNSENQNDSNLEDNTFRVPYYLQNFESIVRCVMDDCSFSCLFDEEDTQVINKFFELTDGGKKLYVRMFSRKLKWIPLAKLKYDEIAKDLQPYLEELADAQLVDCEDRLSDLKEVLEALPAGDIKNLAKSYHINAKITQKNNLVDELWKKTQQTSISSLFGNKGGGIEAAMLKSAKGKLKGIFRLKFDPRSVFVRALMLFSLVNTTGDEDSGNGGQQQLFQMLLVNMGKVVYPTYEVLRTNKIFKMRDSVIRFEQALQMEFNMLTATDKGNWISAYDCYKKVKEQVDFLEKDKDIVEWNTSLPEYLRCFTATSVLYRLMSVGIDIVQRRKDFQEAVDLLWKLLAQTTYCNTHRGYWWERLALNFDVHLKNPKQALEVVQKGLADEHVKVGHRLALFQRAEAICQRPSLKLQKQLKDFHHDPVKEMPKVFIEGRVLHQGVATSGLRFLTESSYTNGNAQDMTVCGVEEFVMDYYKKNGFPSSIHAEGSIVSSLFCLFFWDILFLSIPDAFHSPYQAMPLDLYTESFYLRRKEAIDKRIIELKSSTDDELHKRMEETWTNHHGVQCAGMGWDRVKSIDNMKELVGCMGGTSLSGIVERYAKCPRHTRSGFPDLTLWNIETKTFKICEVKGPGDKLSHKQILWIDYMLGLGIDVEVCHVKAVAAKKLKASTSS